MKGLFTLIILSIITFSNTINLDVSGGSIHISGNFENINLTETNIQGDTFTQLHIKNCVSTGKVGEPELPIYTRLIELPNTGNFILENISFEENIIDLSNAVLPSDFLDEDEINTAEYQRDEWIPSEVVTISDPNIMGAYRFSQIAVSPIQYNPLQKKLRII